MRWVVTVPAVLILTACGGATSPGSGPSPRPGEAVAGHAGQAAHVVALSGGGEFTKKGPAAIVYDHKLAPEGAQASLTVDSQGGKTVSSLVVEGFLPDRAYGAHLHTKPCAADPDAAGPHYQQRHHDPASHGATVANEVWLDLTTDESGSGRATARNAWSLDPNRLPRSLVIHAQHTMSAGPNAGTAGPRVTCMTLS
jgi:superoxide dismutase, Cu-Zn family